MTFDNNTSLCGKCLHNKDTHSASNGHMMFCAKCNKYCDLEEYNTPLKQSGTVVQDGVVYKCQ